MGFLNNDFLEKIYSNPATIVGDYELKLYGDEGFTITNLKTQKESAFVRDLAQYHKAKFFVSESKNL